MIKALKKFFLDFETSGLSHKKPVVVRVAVVEEKKIPVTKVRVGMKIKFRYNYSGIKVSEVVEIQPPPKRSKKVGYRKMYLLRVQVGDEVQNVRLSGDELVTLA